MASDKDHDSWKRADDPANHDLETRIADSQPCRCGAGESGSELSEEMRPGFGGALVLVEKFVRISCAALVRPGEILTDFSTGKKTS